MNAIYLRGNKMGKFINLMMILLLMIAIPVGTLTAGENKNGKKGTIKGRVVDIETQSPIPGATVMLVGTKLGAATDEQGMYAIEKVPVGSYAISFSSLGFDPFTETDVIVRPKRITYAEAELNQAPTRLKDVVVQAGYFAEIEDKTTSTVNYSSEEIRRAPGSAGDVSRIMMTLPSIAKKDDQLNSLIVRGGTPAENAFYLDNIEIPNINHFPVQGTSGGPIGMLNVDLIKDVNFSAGGFGAEYGDRLSSVMEIDYREGNREEFDGQVALSFAGAELTGEGPLDHGKGSWLVSARRSYLDLLVAIGNFGVAPVYSDYHAKLVYDFSPEHRLTFTGVAGVDFIDLTQEDAADEGNFLYGITEGYEFGYGFNWRWLWSKNGFSNTSLSHHGTKYQSDWNETKSGRVIMTNHSLEQTFQLRNVNTFRLNSSNQVKFGFELNYVDDNNDYFLTNYINSFGDSLPSLTVNRSINAPKGGIFLNYETTLFGRLTADLGMRYDYFDYTEKGHFSPRLGLKYKLTERTSLVGSAGIYYQYLPLVIVSQRDEFRDLRTPKAYHFIAGVHHLLGKDTRLTVEGYYKKYEDFPLDPSQPELFVVDEVLIMHNMANFEQLNDDGIAETYGVEMTLQKKLVEGLYGLVTGAIFRSKYRGNDDKWRPRVYDNRYLFSIEGGYKPNSKWEYSARWIFAGGAPYTPLDLTASEAINAAVYDQSAVNGDRYPDYHSLNLRVDRRFYFKGSNLIVYLSVWNAYNRENVSMYYWNEIEQKPDVQHQWTMLPVFGLEYEF